MDNEQPQKKDDEDPSDKDIQFQLSAQDLEAISSAKSEVVPNIPELGKTVYTIENAPIAKNIQMDYMVEITPDEAALNAGSCPLDQAPSGKDPLAKDEAQENEAE
jgi:hypothetical protein